MAKSYFLTERDREDVQEILRAFRSGAFAQPSKNKSHREFSAIQEIAIGAASDAIPADGDGLVDRWTVTNDAFAAVAPADQVTAYDFTGRGFSSGTKIILARVAHKAGTRWVAVTPGGEVTNVYNDSGEIIPAYGCMAVSGVHTDANYIKVTKPSTTFRRQYVPNGATPIPIAGTASIPTRRYYKWLYGSGTPISDLGMGPTPGFWYLTANYPAVTEVAGIFDATAKVVWGTIHTIDTVIGKIASGSSLTPNSTATIDVWAGDATEFAIELTGVKLTLSSKDWFMRSSSLPSGTKVKCTIVNGRWYVTQTQC